MKQMRNSLLLVVVAFFAATSLMAEAQDRFDCLQLYRSKVPRILLGKTKYLSKNYKAYKTFQSILRHRAGINLPSGLAQLNNDFLNNLRVKHPLVQEMVKEGMSEEILGATLSLLDKNSVCPKDGPLLSLEEFIRQFPQLIKTHLPQLYEEWTRKLMKAQLAHKGIEIHEICRPPSGIPPKPGTEAVESLAEEVRKVQVRPKRSSLAHNKGEKEDVVEDEDCPYCCETFGEVPKVTTQCGHTSCGPCINRHLKAKAESKAPSVTCLACKERLRIDPRHYSLLDARLLRLIENEEIHQKMLLSKQFIPCSTRECEYFFPKDSKLPEFTCPLCLKDTCRECGNNHLQNPNCAALKRKQEAADEQMRLQGFMDCPYCGTWSEKVSGCSYVKCNNRFCGRAFDFVTGGAWTSESERRQRQFYNGFHYAEDNVGRGIKKDPRLIRDRNVVHHW